MCSKFGLSLVCFSKCISGCVLRAGIVLKFFISAYLNDTIKNDLVESSKPDCT